MNLVVDLLLQYYREEKTHIYILIAISLIVNLIQANGISYVTAKMVDAVEHRQMALVWRFYGVIVALFSVFWCCITYTNPTKTNCSPNSVNGCDTKFSACCC